MFLTWENKEEAIKVLRFLEVPESTIKYLGMYDEICWYHKFEHHLGGRDGWSSLIIDRGPNYDECTEEDDEEIVVDGIPYKIHEGD